MARISRSKRLWRRALLPLSPFIETIRTYRAGYLPRDLLAGVTVSVVDLPQSMAFALIAGVPPVYGLYTAIFLAFLGALFTSSRFLSVGPTNTQSLLIAAIVSRLTHDPAIYLQLVIGLSLMKGVIQLAFSAARTGQLVRFVSQSVMTGFTAGAGILIFAEQLPGFLGLTRIADSSGLPGVLNVGHRILPHLGEVNLRALAIGAGSLAILLVSRKISEWIPGPLLAVAAGAFTVVLTGWSDIPTIGELPRGLPLFQIPHLSWHQTEQLLPGAAALALLGMLESVAIAKSIAQRTGQRINPDQEFFGQGFANLVGSFFQCMPGSGSFSRTALQYAVGAQTRIAGIVCAISNALIFLLLAPLASHIPLCSLAAILFFVAYKLIDSRSIWRILKSTRPDGVVLLATLAAALFLPLTYAIYAGIFLNIALYLREASRLHLLHLVATDTEGYQESAVESLDLQSTEPAFLQLEGDLFFGVADKLEDHLQDLADSKVPVAIFRLKRTHFIDATVMFVLERFVKKMQARGAHVLFCGVPPRVQQTMKRFGLVKLVGEENLFGSGPGIFQSARQALDRARELTAS